MTVPGHAEAVVTRYADVAPAPPRKRSTLDDFRAGSDLLASVPTIAVFDGSWSIALQVGSLLANRGWDAPYPQGLLAHEATRILYGSSWTLMLGLESLIAVVASGGSFAWLAEANYRTDWIFGLGVPAPCPATGAYGGCGVGIGGFGGLYVRPRGSHWWFEASGGWVQQRVANDERRTLAESTWVLTPLAAAYEVRGEAGPVEVRAQAGPGIYFGMHNAHVHPTLLGRRAMDVPWHELYPLDAGIGPGGRAEIRVIGYKRLSLDAELVMAPFLLGATTTSPSSDLAPLDGPRDGMPVWRKVGLGVSWDHSESSMRAGIAFFGAELSGRNPLVFGHRGVMLRFEFPLRIPGGG